MERNQVHAMARGQMFEEEVGLDAITADQWPREARRQEEDRAQ